MTLAEIKNSQKEMLTATDIAPILNVDPNIIRSQAHAEPKLLGFPVVVLKSRVKIPRKKFIEFLEG